MLSYEERYRLALADVAAYYPTPAIKAVMELLELAIEIDKNELVDTATDRAQEVQGGIRRLRRVHGDIERTSKQGEKKEKRPG